MNKMAVVLGVAAVATLAGCKDPQYSRVAPTAQDEAKSVETSAAPEEIAVSEVKAPKCKCAPGTRHSKPCACGAADCLCIVEVKPVEPEYTIYIVQPADYLAKISKKFNVKVDTIKKLNNLKGDNVRLGQKLKLPGKIEVGEQKVPAAAIKKSVKKPYESYKGETKEYVVASGDTLGKIAYSNGMNIRQLKELNGLKKDSLRIGQKLKVAAGKAEAKAAESPAETKVETPAPVVPEKVEALAPVDAAKPAAETKQSEPAPAAASAEGASSYVVQEGDTLPRIAIDFEVPVARIRELNNLGEGDEVKAGQVLKIPAAQ